MDSPKFAALLSSLLSQLLLLLFLHFPSSLPHSLFSIPHSHGNPFPLISHFLFSQEIASSLLSRKRKRTHSPESESKSESISVSVSSRLRLIRSPDSFPTHFRMTSSTFQWLSGLLEPLLDCRDPVGSPIDLPAELRLALGLTRLATGSDFSAIAAQFGVSETVARFCSKQLCRVLCTNFRFWVEFPNPTDLVVTSSSFQDLAGIPNCCGVVSCVRFNVSKTNNSSEDSVAAQLVVDSSSRILSVFAGYRGEKGDSSVLSCSTLFKDVEEGRILNSGSVLVNGKAVNQYLLGNGDYPLLPWLMVPFAGAVSGSIEESFNEAHRLMCSPVIRAIVSLRGWGILSQPIKEEFKTAVAYIGACSILHNALLMRDDFSALAEEWESFSLDDYSSQSENSVEEKAYVMQRALAEKAKEFQK